MGIFDKEKSSFFGVGNEASPAEMHENRIGELSKEDILKPITHLERLTRSVHLSIGAPAVEGALASQQEEAA